jgi:hypothetical protein
MAADESARVFEPGTFVEVRNGFDGSWCPGFEIDQVVADGYVVRRWRDGAVLPKTFSSARVRAPASAGVIL